MRNAHLAIFIIIASTSLALAGNAQELEARTIAAKIAQIGEGAIFGRFYTSKLEQAPDEIYRPRNQQPNWKPSLVETGPITTDQQRNFVKESNCFTIGFAEFQTSKGMGEIKKEAEQFARLIGADVVAISAYPRQIPVTAPGLQIHSDSTYSTVQGSVDGKPFYGQVTTTGPTKVTQEEEVFAQVPGYGYIIGFLRYRNGSN